MAGRWSGRLVPGQDIVSYHRDPRTDPAILHEPAAVVLRGTRVR